MALAFNSYRRQTKIETAEPAVVEEIVTPSAEPVVNEEDATPSAELARVLSFVASADEQNAWELLQSQAEVQFKSYDFGIFIEGINGLMADGEHFWAIYVNGESAMTGISDIILQQNDMMELKYETLE